MLITLRQAEKITGYSADTLRNRIKDGTIQATLVKNRYMIDERDLELHTKKVAKSRVHEQSHAEREVPQETPFLVKKENPTVIAWIQLMQQRENNRQMEETHLHELMKA